MDEGQDPTRTAQTFWEANGDQIIVAASALLIALVLAFIVETAFRRRGRQMAEAVLRGEVSRETETRLLFVRRLVSAVIILIGLFSALSQFDGVNRIATSLLASGVVAAAVVGFAARQTLANFVAGVMLAVTQPVRVGDWVTIEERSGQVEDVRLNYTVLRTPGDQRIVIPNEKLASSVLVNDTLAVDAVGIDVEVWIPPGADAERARAVLTAESGADVAVAEATTEGVRLALGGPRVAPADRPGAEADLRARCLARLRAEGLLEDFAPDRRS